MKAEGYIYRQDMTPNTRVAVTGKNRVYSYAHGMEGWTQLGVVSTFDHSDSRDVTAVRGIGFGDQIAELVPGVSAAYELTVNRTLLYLSDMFQIFGYKSGVDGLVRAMKHHKWPFDIRSEYVFTEIKEVVEGGKSGTADAILGDASALVTLYEACWMTSYGTSRGAEDTVITEDGSVSATDISDALSSIAVDDENAYGPISETGNNHKSIRFGGSGGQN